MAGVTTCSDSVRYAASLQCMLPLGTMLCQVAMHICVDVLVPGKPCTFDLMGHCPAKAENTVSSASPCGASQPGMLVEVVRTLGKAFKHLFDGLIL